MLFVKRLGANRTITSNLRPEAKGTELQEPRQRPRAAQGRTWGSKTAGPRGRGGSLKMPWDPAKDRIALEWRQVPKGRLLGEGFG